MSLICRHCSNTISGEPVSEVFCCVGCREVYSLIHDQGLVDFYSLQDRVAQPLKDRELPSVDADALKQTQTSVEAAEVAQASFSVSGMSCMGCVWLVQRLALRQSGVLRAEVSLSDNRLEIAWEAASFSLPALGAELYRFGYSLDPKPLTAAQAWSPIAVRTLLTAVFTANAFLLFVYQDHVVSSSAHGGLLSLLSLACLAFTLILSMPPFVLSVYHAARIHRLHTDWIPVAVVLSASLAAAAGLQSRAMSYTLAVSLVSSTAFICLLARWLGGWITHRRV